MKHTFTALLTGNRREVHTSSPKALLVDIYDPEGVLNRNHCWISISNIINKIQPKGHQKPIKVEFTAKLKPYMKQGIEQQYTLTSIRNIVIRV